jgi:hypothetical protein
MRLGRMSTGINLQFQVRKVYIPKVIEDAGRRQAHKSLGA